MNGHGMNGPVQQRVTANIHFQVKKDMHFLFPLPTTPTSVFGVLTNTVRAMLNLRSP